MLRSKEVKNLQGALNKVGFGLDYKQTELITKVANFVAKKGDETTLRDLSEIEADWEKKWSDYENSVQDKSAGRPEESTS